MFIKLNKCGFELQLKDPKLNDEMETIPGRKIDVWIREKDIKAADWEFKESEISSVNVDNVLYITPFFGLAKGQTIEDEKSIKMGTEIHFKDGSTINVDEGFNDLCERIHKVLCNQSNGASC